MGVVLATFKATGTLPIGTKLPVRKRDDATFQPGEVLAMKAKPDNSHSTHRIAHGHDMPGPQRPA